MTQWISEDQGYNQEGEQTFKETETPKEDYEADYFKYLIIGVIAFCGFAGLSDFHFGIKGSCVESDENVCCRGVSHPLIIQGDKVKLGSKVFSDEEVRLLKRPNAQNTESTYSIFKDYDKMTESCEFKWSDRKCQNLIVFAH